MKSVNPYLSLNGNSEEVFDHYKKIFGGELAGVVRFKDLKDNMGLKGDNLNKIANIALPLGKHALLMGDDGQAVFGKRENSGAHFSINLEAENKDEAEKLFKGLAQDGKETMPLQQTEWAELFGMCEDKFGICWSVNFTGNAQLPTE